MSVTARQIVVDGNKLPWHSSYSANLQKNYVKQPKRTISGAIRVFPRSFFVPTFKVTWAYLTMPEYHEIVQSCVPNEVTCEWYNPDTYQWEVRNFFVQLPDYPVFDAQEGHYRGVIGYSATFVGTLNAAVPASISFNANGGTGSMPQIDGYLNEVWTVPVSTFTPPAGKVFVDWNTRADGEAAHYVAGQKRVMVDLNLTLYATYAEV